MAIKDGAFFCYCAYVLRISAWSAKVGFLLAVAAKTEYFCAVYNHAGKADLGKGYWNPKRKSGVTSHFSEIIKLQFAEKRPYIALYFGAF